MRASFVSTGIAVAVILASVPAFAAPPSDDPPPQTPSSANPVGAPPEGETPEGETPEGDDPEGGEDLKPSPEQQAMELFRNGEEAYAQAEYAQALEHFQDAQSLYPSAVFHYNIGQCYEALEKLEQAVTSYRAYLRSNPADAANVERKVETLQAQIDSGASLGPEPQPKPLPPPEPDDRKKGFPAGALIGVGAAGIVLGGVGLGVGAGVFGTRAASLSDDLNAVNDGGNPALLTREEAQELERQGQTAQTLQIVFMSVGGALAVLGTAEIISGIVLMRKKKAAESQPSVTAAPVFTTSGAGLSLTGRF